MKNKERLKLDEEEKIKYTWQQRVSRYVGETVEESLKRKQFKKQKKNLQINN